MEASGQCHAPAAPHLLPSSNPREEGTPPVTHWSRRLGEPQSRYGHFREDSILPLGVSILYPTYTDGGVMALVNTAQTKLCEKSKQTTL